MLSGIIHSALWEVGRTSKTDTGFPLSNHLRRVSTSKVFTAIASLFLQRSGTYKEVELTIDKKLADCCASNAAQAYLGNAQVRCNEFQWDSLDDLRVLLYQRVVPFFGGVEL
jgi:hypothetical protein